eukprot:gene8506-11498_t
MSSVCFTVESCLCPCCILGDISTKQSREHIYTCTKYVCFHPLNSSGCKTCCKTATYAICCWPCSPFLILYLNTEMKKWKVVYRNEETFNYNVNEKFLESIFWPNTLLRLYKFVLSEHQTGTLTFDWDINEYYDQVKKSPPEYETIRVMIINSFYGKVSDFMKKFMHSLEYPNESKPMYSENALPRDNIKIGFSRIPSNTGRIFFLEVWDAPSTEVDSAALRKGLSDCDGVIFLFDGDDDSYHNMQSVFDKLRNILPPVRICISKSTESKDDKIHEHHNKPFTPKHHKHNDVIDEEDEDSEAYAKSRRVILELFRVEMMKSWAEQNNVEFEQFDTNNVAEVMSLRKKILMKIDSSSFASFLAIDKQSI